MRHYIERLRRQINPGRITAFLLAALVLGLALCSAVFTRKIITVEDSAGGTHVMMTASRQPQQYMDLASLVAGRYDQLDYTDQDRSAASITIYRAFPVAVMADGFAHRAEMVGGTVADLLAECEIVLEGEDYVEPALDTPVAEDMQAEVFRVAYSEESTRTEVGPEQVAAYTEQLYANDPNAYFRESNAGLYDVTYRHRHINGEVVSSEITALAAVIMPRPAGSTEFSPGIPCSRIAGYDDIPMGPDGRPSGGWSRVMEGANCTAYSSSGGRGASGLGLYNGTVAVNPNVIPYGTRMWIESADGSFTYGFAIATDTGIAMMQSSNAIDLYFETNGECLRFGRRPLNVYIFG